MNSEEIASTLLSKFFERVQQDALPTIVRATVPFYYVIDNQIKRDRSGVLVRIGDDFFILTASHGLGEKVEANICLHVGWDNEKSIPVPISKARFHCTEKNIRDVAVIKLSSSEAKQLLTSSEPISLRQIEMAANRRPGFFITCGYPQAWMRKLPDRIESEPLPFLGCFYQGASLPTNTFEYDDNLHMLIEFSQKAIQCRDSQERVLPSVEGIKGISGCGVWRIADYSSESIKSWKPDDCMLVGIQHRYWQKQGCVAATWIKFVLDRMVADYPELIPAMRLVYTKS